MHASVRYCCLNLKDRFQTAAVFKSVALKIMVDKIASSSEELEICIFEVVVVVVLNVVALTIAACMQ